MIVFDTIKRDEPLTPQASADERKHLVAIYAREGVMIDIFTCDNCDFRGWCLLAFDAYNTDGECLAEK